MRQKKRWSRREMSRTIVIHCVNVLTLTLVWAAALKTAASAFGWTAELSDVLTFAAASFGGELALLAFKRVFARDGGADATDSRG